MSNNVIPFKSATVLEFPRDLVQHHFDRADRVRAVKQAAAEAGKDVTPRHLSFARHPSVTSAADLRAFVAKS